jgi:hypothetical protein
MVNETDVKNNKLSCTEDRGSSSVWKDGIQLAKYTESHTGRHACSSLDDISNVEGISDGKLCSEIAILYATVTAQSSSSIRWIGNDSYAGKGLTYLLTYIVAYIHI